MKLFSNKKDFFLLAGMTAAIAVSIIIGLRIGSSIPLRIASSVLLIILLFVHLECYRRLMAQQQNHEMEWFRQRKQDYRQLEALLFLLSTIAPKHPLPPMREWSISPDIANIILSLILDHRPKTIVECGGGVSTLIISYCLKELGTGHLYSLEHDAKYIEVTRENLANHDLLAFASAIHAPLVEVPINGRTWLWYDPHFLKDLPEIDLLIIDGPPRTIQQDARYPALPLLMNSLSSKAIIVLDDAHREDEKSTVRQWVEEFPSFSLKMLDTEFGTAILQKSESPIFSSRLT